MKNNLLTLTFLAALTFGLPSCSKKCETLDPACSEIVEQTDSIICYTIHTGWFYDKESNTCKQITYSGCKDFGFETQKECEKCKCNKR